MASNQIACREEMMADFARKKRRWKDILELLTD
jgi:hypothetical protein